MKLKTIKLISVLLSVMVLISGCSADKTSDAVPSESIQPSVSQRETVSAETVPAETVPTETDRNVGLNAYELQNDEQRTLDLLIEISDGIFVLDYYSDYKTEDYLASDITDVSSLDMWMTQKLTHNVPAGDIKNTGCIFINA